MPAEESMDGKKFIACAERDAVVIDALHHALYAMAMATGSSVIQGGMNDTLDFGRDMAKIRKALELLGVDTTQPLPIPYYRK